MTKDNKHEVSLAQINW